LLHCNRSTSFFLLPRTNPPAATHPEHGSAALRADARRHRALGPLHDAVPEVIGIAATLVRSELRNFELELCGLVGNRHVDERSTRARGPHDGPRRGLTSRRTRSRSRNSRAYAADRGAPPMT